MTESDLNDLNGPCIENTVLANISGNQRLQTATLGTIRQIPSSKPSIPRCGFQRLASAGKTANWRFMSDLLSIKL